MYKGQLESKLLLTRKFAGQPREIYQILQSVPCVLCTLGLSSSRLIQKHVFPIVPPMYVLVDEASQIKILDFMVGGTISFLARGIWRFTMPLTASLPQMSPTWENVLFWRSGTMWVPTYAWSVLSQLMFDKSVPSYDQNEVPTVKTVFDIQHLKPSTYFLNIQCKHLNPEQSFSFFNFIL